MKVMQNKYKLVFFGSPFFASYSLENLIKADFHITAVVTQPPKIKGRNQVKTETDLAKIAQKYNLKTITPEIFNDDIFAELKNLSADAFIVVAYGKIIPQTILNLPPHGVINIHPSLLPKYRGPSPVQTALLNNEKITGVSIMKIDNKVDHGPILFQVSEQIKNDDNNVLLTDRLFQIGAKYLPDILWKYLNKNLTPQPQDDNLATYTKLIKKQDGLINWLDEAVYINQQIKAYQPWPTAYSYCQNKLYKFYKGKIIKGKLPPGKIIVDKKNRQLLVGTGKDLLSVDIIQPEGKNKLPIKDFILGYNLGGLFFTTHPKT